MRKKKSLVGIKIDTIEDPDIHICSDGKGKVHLLAIRNKKEAVSFVISRKEAQYLGCRPIALRK